MAGVLWAWQGEATILAFAGGGAPSLLDILTSALICSGLRALYKSR
jgi:hypothetical protein